MKCADKLVYTNRKMCESGQTSLNKQKNVWKYRQIHLNKQNVWKCGQTSLNKQKCVKVRTNKFKQKNVWNLCETAVYTIKSFVKQLSTEVFYNNHVHRRSIEKHQGKFTVTVARRPSGTQATMMPMRKMTASSQW